MQEDIVITQVDGQKWYQRRVYRAIFVGCILLTCILVGVVVGLMMQPSPPTSISTPEQIACDFIAQTSLSELQLQHTVVQTNGLVIPSEI